MNFMRSEMSRKQRMACCNEVCFSVLREDVRAIVTLVLSIDRLCDDNALYTCGWGTAEYWDILLALCVCVCVRTCVTICITHTTQFSIALCAHFL
jgi:hypothetical protein